MTWRRLTVPVYLGVSVLGGARRRKKVKEITVMKGVVPLQELYCLSLESSWPKLPLGHWFWHSFRQLKSVWRDRAMLIELLVAEWVEPLWAQKDSHGRFHDGHREVSQVVKDLQCLMASLYCIFLLPYYDVAQKLWAVGWPGTASPEVGVPSPK